MQFNIMLALGFLLIKCSGFHSINLKTEFIDSFRCQSSAKDLSRLNQFPPIYMQRIPTSNHLPGFSRILRKSFHKNTRCYMSAEIVEFDDDIVDSSTDSRTDEEKGLTHGYEGDVKIGDVVRVNRNFKIFSVKAYAQAGFDPYGMTGTVVGLALYGRKTKSLCSAITPVKVEFQVDGEGIPQGMFERKWLAHFAGDELVVVSRNSATI